MNYLLSIFSTIFFGLATAQSSAAAERIELDLHDAHFRGSNTIHIKHELNRQYPYLGPRNLELKSVRLVAKTGHGRGWASLRVGPWFSERRRVLGNPRDFNHHRPRTFDLVDFYNDSYDSRGPWQLNLNGDFIVRKVVLTVERDRYRPAPTPPPRRGGHDFRLECASRYGRYQVCRAPGVIARARLVREFSRGRRCSYGRGWGYSASAVWVNHGCHGVFEIETRR